MCHREWFPAATGASTLAHQRPSLSPNSKERIHSPVEHSVHLPQAEAGVERDNGLAYGRFALVGEPLS